MILCYILFSIICFVVIQLMVVPVFIYQNYILKNVFLFVSCYTRCTFPKTIPIWDILLNFRVFYPMNLFVIVCFCCSSFFLYFSCSKNRPSKSFCYNTLLRTLFLFQLPFKNFQFHFEVGESFLPYFWIRLKKYPNVGEGGSLNQDSRKNSLRLKCGTNG